MGGDMDCFPARRELLNARFSAYKLTPPSTPAHIRTIALPQHLPPPTASHTNQLALNKHSGQLIWTDTSLLTLAQPHSPLPLSPAADTWLLLDGPHTLLLAALCPGRPRILAAAGLRAEHGFGPGPHALVAVARAADAFHAVLTTTTLHVLLARIRIVAPADPAGQHAIQPLLLARLHGTAPLLAAHYHRPSRRWCLRSTAAYVALPPTGDHPTGDHPAEEDPAATPPLPYTWSQTPEALTLVARLPGPVARPALAIGFHPRALELRLPGVAGGDDGLDRRLALWAAIAPDACTWYLESCSQTSSSTTLTIELEKQARWRWPQVFETDDGVMETVSADEAQAMGACLAGYTDDGTGTTRRGLGAPGAPTSGAAGQGPGQPMSSLTAGEMDLEIDVDDPVMVTGTVVSWLVEQSPGTGGSEAGWRVQTAGDAAPVELIATPLLVAHPSPAQTFPALAFVGASKRHIWRSLFTPKHALLVERPAAHLHPAIPSATLATVFVYHHAPSPQTQAVQQVISLPTSSPLPNPALLGICAIQGPEPDSPLSVFVLSQHEIVIFDL
ncbi:hypothetical protein PtB15_2B133 [Puccinia triticina]|nr:hypothetical protein PtB15_2B133 [Puccinia triticina]